MDFKNVNLNDYCLNLDLHKSMFFIDMLKDTYEFTLKGDEIEIFKKLKNGISEPTTRKELIYFIQIEMVEKYEYRYIKERVIYADVPNQEKPIQKFYDLFNKIDSIHKTIDNMVYLEKYLKRHSVIVPEQLPKKVIVESAPPKKPECGGWEEDEEESSDEEEVNELGENKKIVLKNALEKECLSARTELFRPAWRPPR